MSKHKAVKLPQDEFPMFCILSLFSLWFMLFNGIALFLCFTCSFQMSKNVQEVFDFVKNNTSDEVERDVFERTVLGFHIAPYLS